jgi:hypothetical protein
VSLLQTSFSSSLSLWFGLINARLFYDAGAMQGALKLPSLLDKPEHAVAYFATASVTKAIKSFLTVFNLHERVLGLLFLFLLLVLVQQGGRLHHDAELNQAEEEEADASHQVAILLCFFLWKIG